MNRDLIVANAALQSVLQSQFRSLRQVEKSRQFPRPSNLQSGLGITGDFTRVGLASAFTWENALSSGTNVSLDRGRWLLIAAVNFAPDVSSGTAASAFDAGLRIVTPSATREVVIQGIFAGTKTSRSFFTTATHRFSPNVVLAVTENEAFNVQVQGGFKCNSTETRMFYGTDILMTIPG